MAQEEDISESIMINMTGMGGRREPQIDVAHIVLFITKIISQRRDLKLYFNKANAIVNLSAGGKSYSLGVCQKYFCYFHCGNNEGNNWRWHERAGF